MNRIEATFGKKGSGKTNLLFCQMRDTGGRIVYFSPVAPPPYPHTTVWSLIEIELFMQDQQPGQIMYVMNTSLDAFDMVCCHAVINQDYSIFIDEADHYVKSTELSDLIDYGRHSRINIFGNTRRYTDIPRKLTANADYINVFRTVEPRDIAYLRDYCGRNPINSVPELKPYEYLRYNTDTSNWCVKKEKCIDI